MKKILFILSMFLLIASASHAQTGIFAMTGANTLALDTVTNTATKYMSGTAKGYMKTVAVQVTFTKISGTLAGSATLQASVDGVSFYPVPGAGTFTLTDVASQGAVWSVIDSPYQFYRVSITGSGTMAASFSGQLLNRKAL